MRVELDLLLIEIKSYKGIQYCYVKAKPKAEIRITDIQDFMQVLIDCSYQKQIELPISVLADLRDIRLIDDRARHYLQNERVVHKRVGILVESLMSRVVGNFMIGLNKGIFPVKLFDSSDAALNWFVAEEMTSAENQLEKRV